MSTLTMSRPKRRVKTRRMPQPTVIAEKEQNRNLYPHNPNYITLMPPGSVLEEKLFEMGVDADELAKRMNIPAVMCPKIKN